MDSNTHQSFQHQNHPPNTGLLRFRSAPSSLLMSCTDVAAAAGKGGSGESFETERLISRFISNNDSVSPTFRGFEDKSQAAAAVSEAAAAVSYSNSPRGYSGLPPHYPRQNSLSTATSMDSSYGLVGSVAMDQQKQLKPVNSISNLMRQNSSPAGLFSQFSVPNGLGAARGMGDYRLGNGANGELNSSTKRLRSQLSLSSRLPSSLGMLSQISEIGDESIEDSNPLDGKLGYPFRSWNDPLSFSGMKREQEDDHESLFSGPQNGELGNRVRLLSHHLSLPKTSSEMVAVEKFLHYQDSVPCKIRAKRGCATHPRSIAERVRRTRISERMRKLQELVPNMDKQTNTSDMLDLAVDYIKDLQRQFKTLSDHRANCKCLNSQRPVSNRTI